MEEVNEMALKRKPPTGNVRRVAPIGNNLRYAITSKADETVQCESFQERKLTLLFDRDPTIQEYRTPSRFLCNPTLGSQFSIPITQNSRWPPPRMSNSCCASSYAWAREVPVGSACSS